MVDSKLPQPKVPCKMFSFREIRKLMPCTLKGCQRYHYLDREWLERYPSAANEFGKQVDEAGFKYSVSPRAKAYARRVCQTLKVPRIDEGIADMKQAYFVLFTEEFTNSAPDKYLDPEKENRLEVLAMMYLYRAIGAIVSPDLFTRVGVCLLDYLVFHLRGKGPEDALKFFLYLPREIAPLLKKTPGAFEEVKKHFGDWMEEVDSRTDIVKVIFLNWSVD